jgi:hypothetical protein
MTRTANHIHTIARCLAVGCIAVVKWHHGFDAGCCIVIMVALWHRIGILFVLCYRQGAPLVIHPLRLEA